MRWRCLLGHRWTVLPVSPVVEVALRHAAAPMTVRLTRTGPTMQNRACVRDGCGARVMALDRALLWWTNETARLRASRGQQVLMHGHAIGRVWAPAPPGVRFTLEPAGARARD